MKAFVLTSTSHRHRYLISVIRKEFEVTGVVCQAKKNYYNEARRSELVQNHFDRLQRTEADWFRDAPELEEITGLRLVDDVNSSSLVQQVRQSGADVVILNGTAILKPVWLNAFPGRVINLHLGLAPFYKGSATLFWPFADGNLGLLGTTIHLAVEQVDAGDILRRILPDWVEGDDYYAITNRLIRKSMNLLPEVIKAYLRQTLVPVPQESIPGRMCKKTEFSEAALERAIVPIAQGIRREQIQRALSETPCLSC